MKRYISIIILSVLLFGCAKSPFGGDNDSSLRVRPSADAQLNILTKAPIENAITRADAPYNIPTKVDDYTIKVTNKAGGAVVMEGLSLSQNAEISLPKGKYTVELESTPKTDAAFDQPMYKGSAECTTVTGKSTTLDITTRLSCVVVDVEHSERMLTNFLSCTTTIMGNGTDKVIFDQGVQSGRLAYLSTPLTTLSYKIEVVTQQGVSFSSQGTVDDLESGDLLKLAFDIEQPTPSDKEPLVLNLLLDRQINETSKTFSLGATMGATGVPTITGRLLDISKPVGVKYGEGSTIRIDLGTPGGLSNILLMFKPGNSLPQAGGAEVVDIIKADARDALGVTFDQGGTAGSEGTLMNLTEFSKLLPGSATGTQSFNMVVGVKDLNGQYTAREITFNIYGVSIITLAPSNGESIDWLGAHGPLNMVNATLNGQFNLESEPEGMVFMYCKEGEAWQIADPVIDRATKMVSFDLSVLPDGSTWLYRLVTDSETGDTYSFTCPTYPVINNLMIDSWAGDTPAAPWGTSNNQFGTNVTPTTGWNGEGLGARIESKPIFGVFASGAFFTGQMVMDIGSPYKSSQVGIPYVGRPIKLTGYFKYTGKAIDKIASENLPGNGAKKLAPDQCEIAIKLEKWGSADYKIRWMDGFALGGFDEKVGPKYNGATNGRAVTELRRQISIGYGQLMTTAQEDWTYFEIPVTYYQNQQPDHIIITAVSSAWGGYLCGGVGSLLMVDNLSLVY